MLEAADEERLAVAEKLVDCSRADWRNADLCLRDAQETLSAIISAEHFHELLRRRQQLPQLASDLRSAIRQSDWTRAEELARRGARLRAEVGRSERLLAVATAVFGKRLLEPSTTALALSGAVALPAAVLERELGRVCSDYRDLARCELEYAEVYEHRALELARLDCESPAMTSAHIDAAELREAGVLAADRGDFAAALRVAQDATRSGLDRLGRIRAPLPTGTEHERLAAPLPDSVLERAAEIGLEAVTLEADDSLNAYLSCACAAHPSLPVTGLSGASRELELCTCGHSCPPGLGAELKSSLDALMVHVFLTSDGTRYLPWFGAETVLVEVHSEERPDAPTGLIQALELPRRLGVSRAEIEHKLLSRGIEACIALGCDPLEYRIACIPFDVYSRLGARQGWGRCELWTHFDGYQVTRDLTLQALVGGDVRFGGPGDLCGVGRTYESKHVSVRFAVLKRARFGIRMPTRNDDATTAPS